MVRVRRARQLPIDRRLKVMTTSTRNGLLPSLRLVTHSVSLVPLEHTKNASVEGPR
jgi:hypothetical protein